MSARACYEKGGQRAVVIRMPIELHDAVKAKAAREHRSAAQAMRHALALYIAEDRSPLGE